MKVYVSSGEIAILAGRAGHWRNTVTDALVNLLSGQSGVVGFLAVIVAMAVVAISVLWRALQKERSRTSTLVDKMLEMSAETAIIIERITGRGK